MRLAKLARRHDDTLWQRLHMPARAGVGYLAATDNVEPPLLREGLFNNTQLESHARSLATDRRWDRHRGPEMLLRRLAENEKIIGRSYEEVAEAIRQGHPQAPAAKWLVEIEDSSMAVRPTPDRAVT